MNFGERLKSARREAGLSQNDLAIKLNVSASMIGQYETGKRNPKKDTIEKIANALNLGYSYTKEGEPYFYDFVDTVHRPEYVENGKFNNAQYNNAKKKRIIENYDKLNYTGQDKLFDYAEDLTTIPKYQKDDK
ncbi:MAG: helix-turn-helix transcriptional regulator [Dorea sp.]|jgi:transcriptional regulator with XRE-family HTH domain|nr:helix-turn-helix transcriptional regulator [Dorea sp.]